VGDNIKTDVQGTSSEDLNHTEILPDRKNITIIMRRDS
jgi:hypothetical protein